MRTSFDTAPALGPRPGLRRDGHARPLRGGGLPDGTQLTWATAWMVEIAGRGDETQIQLSIWPAEEGSGTPLYWGSAGSIVWAYFGAQHPAALAADAFTTGWLNRLSTDATLVRQLTGVFGLVTVDQSKHRVFVAGDRLGVQGIHYSRDDAGVFRASTHLMWLLKKTRHDGDVDDTAFLAHLGFGYPVAPNEHVYHGVRKLPTAGYLSLTKGQANEGRYGSDFDDATTPVERDLPAITRALAGATDSAAPGVARCIGLTGGKDSLCLVSVTPRDQRPASATFGAPSCADRLQAEQLAASVGWPHVAGSLCGAGDFSRWATHVAHHSAGLATASYVDMAAFVAECVPAGHALVMGEGGECVRDFFEGIGTKTDRLRNDYMTAGEYLGQTLLPRFSERLKEYPDDLLQTVHRCSGRSDPTAFAVWFYRSQRMAGNFSLRHSVLSALRPKLSPFLDGRFIDAAYAIHTDYYAGSALHRAIIDAARPELLTFFDHPVSAAVGTQDWPKRFATTIGPVVAHLLDDAMPFCRDVFDIDGVRALCRETIARPSRAMYYLFRVLSFALGRQALRAAPPSAWSATHSEASEILDPPVLVLLPASSEPGFLTATSS